MRQSALQANLDELNTDLCSLQNHLDGILGLVRQNSGKLQRFQLLESRLLGLNSLPELIDQLFEGIRVLFELDAIGLCLLDPDGELRDLLEDEEGIDADQLSGVRFLDSDEPLQARFGQSMQPYLGEYQADSCALFFPAAPAVLGSVTLLPLKRRERYLGALNLGSVDSERFHTRMGTHFLERLANVFSVCLENTLSFGLLRRTSLKDPLTGVNNRRFFEQRLAEEINRAQRSGEALSCLFLDIDHFKTINDRHGHPVGDQVLSGVAGVIRSLLRSSDVLARYGGEEFVILLAGAVEKKAIEVGERIRHRIEDFSPYTSAANAIRLTLSVGVATFMPKPGGHTADLHGHELVEQADRALYEAKRKGRNRVLSGGVIPLRPPLPVPRVS